jgi:single-stranded-DNA-specific exonuclease
VLEFLNGFDIGKGEGSFGHGHDQASGGSLPVERWAKLKEKMGFAP